MKIKLILKRIGFYILSFTGGLPLSLIGLIVITFSSLFGRVRTFHGRLYAIGGSGGGGFELGCFFVTSKKTANDDELRAHEAGHGLQNMIFGPLTIFISFLPSIIRYGFREIGYYNRGKTPKTAYDDIWFERTASEGGEKFVLTDRI